VTDLARLDGPATASVSGQLVAVYRAAMSAEPFLETEVETGWFAEELAGEVGEPGFRCWVARDGDRLLERLLAAAGRERAWLVTHDLGTPARALYRSLGFRELGHGPLGWHDADRLVLGADLRTGSAQPDPPASGPPVGEATSPAE
jgi:hypothetical protein